MSVDPSRINFAKLSGIDSVPAAAVFAALYVLLFGWFVGQSIRKPTSVLFSLAFFCAVRVAGFVIRALEAANESAGETFGLLIAEKVLFDAGFSGLLFSAYNLVLDRELISGHPLPKYHILHFTKNRLLYRIGLSAAVALAIASIAVTDASSTRNTVMIKALHVASTAVFFLLTLLQIFQTLLLAHMEMTGKRDYSDKESRKIGTRNAIYILLIISALILIREAFSIATVNNAEKQNNEHFWYPLIALPEILAVVLYTTRGLVPSRSARREVNERK